MVLRNIIRIDEEKCTGCGLCVITCAEGAIKIVNGKAKLISEKYCDGLGACIGECPEGAITIEKREAEEFDEKAVEEHLKTRRQIPVQLPHPIVYHARHSTIEACPSTQVMSFERATRERNKRNLKACEIDACAVAGATNTIATQRALL
jgi:ferredoxin